jgi:hypothetical protein
VAKHDVRFDEPPTTVPGPALWGIVAAGGLVGAAIGLSATGERDEAWLVWMLLAVALTAAAALTGVIGWRAWDLLGWLYHGMERPKRQLLWDLAPVVIILAALAAYGIYNTSYRGELLVATTLVGGTPAIAALAEARRILREPTTNGGLGDMPFDALVELRLLLRRLLAAGGALVALSTLALGASLERPTTGSVTRSGSIPKPSVLVFGALGSAIVGSSTSRRLQHSATGSEPRCGPTSP